MRISDWSSDVCSSDLEGMPARAEACRSHCKRPAARRGNRADRNGRAGARGKTGEELKHFRWLRPVDAEDTGEVDEFGDAQCFVAARGIDAAGLHRLDRAGTALPAGPEHLAALTERRRRT